MKIDPFRYTYFDTYLPKNQHLVTPNSGLNDLSTIDVLSAIAVTTVIPKVAPET